MPSPEWICVRCIIGRVFEISSIFYAGLLKVCNNLYVSEIDIEKDGVKSPEFFGMFFLCLYRRKFAMEKISQQRLFIKTSKARFPDIKAHLVKLKVASRTFHYPPVIMPKQPTGYIKGKSGDCL